MNAIPKKTLFKVSNLNVLYTSNNEAIQALKEVNLEIVAGEVLAIVGETGSGKTTLGRTLMNLNAENTSTKYDLIEYNENKLSINQLGELRGKEIAMLFQEPTVYLNPVSTCGSQILEVLRLEGVHVGDAQEMIIKGFKELGFKHPGRIYRSYPNQLSGGECQRVMLLMSTIRTPKLLIADEPTSSVDLATKEKIFDYFDYLINEKKTSIILITHDLSMALNRADRITIMYEGKITDNLDVGEFEASKKSSYAYQLFDRGSRLKEAEISKPQPGRSDFLQVSSLNIEYKTSGGRSLFFNRKKSAVIDASFQLKKGECLGILGESGSGKTSLAWSIADLITKISGSIDFAHEITNKSDIQVVFQNPGLALNPKQRVGKSVEEVIYVNRSKHDNRDKRQLSLEYFDMVNLDHALLNRYPHELSGGERQRVCIAKALAAKPELIIFDEAVSSLDAGVKVDILELLIVLRNKLSLTYIFISHDFSVIKFVAERVMVMQEGRIIEQNSTEHLIRSQENPITSKLVLQS